MTFPKQLELNKEVKIFFISTDPVTPVVESQVLETVLLLRKKQINANVIFLLQTRHYINLIKTRAKDLSKASAFTQVWLLPSQNNAFSRIAGSLLLAWIAFRQKKTSNIIFHCRGLRSTDIAIRASKIVKNARVVCDVRGDLLAEAGFSSKPKELVDQLFTLEDRCIRQSDHSLYVSEYLRDIIIKRHNLTKDNSSVMYCTANRDKMFSQEHRSSIRKQLGVNDELVFIYTGSIGRWHCFDTVISISETIADIYKNVRFIFLVNQQDEARSIVAKSTITNRSEVLSVAPEKIGAYLSGADVAFLIREAHPLNAAASPVKFAEYLINGLPVIMTDAINDYATMMRCCKNGIVLDAKRCGENAYAIQMLSQVKQEQWKEMRNGYPSAITDTLSKDNYVAKLQRLYGSLTQQ